MREAIANVSDKYRIERGDRLLDQRRTAAKFAARCHWQVH
jgi:hypothetical protein